MAFGVRAHGAQYSAIQQGNLLFLNNPYGTKTFLGDLEFGSLSSYRFEVPISELRPPSQPAAGGAGGGGAENSSGNSSGQSTKSPTNLDSEEMLVVQANRLYQENKISESLQFVEELLRRNPGHIRGWMMKGSLMHTLGHKDFAKQAWDKAAELDPSNEQMKNVKESYQ